MKPILHLKRTHIFRAYNWKYCALMLIALALLASACSLNPATTALPEAGENRPPSQQGTAVEALRTLTGAPNNGPVGATGVPLPVTADPIQPPDTGGQTEPPGSQQEQPALVCSGELTPENTEGPYYTPGSPEKTSLLEPGMEGTVILVRGYVVSPECAPLSGVMIDFWQADAAGNYDNAGYRLRGHLFTVEDGFYQLETILPGEYPGRPPHIHVKVFYGDNLVLTTQMYFPGQDSNEQDSFFDEALLVKLEEGAEGLAGSFTFVVPGP